MYDHIYICGGTKLTRIKTIPPGTHLPTSPVTLLLYHRHKELSRIFLVRRSKHIVDQTRHKTLLCTAPKWG